MAPLRAGGRLLSGALLSIALGACEDSSSGGASPPATYWVFADSAEESVTAAQVDLSGLASCDACPPDDVAFGGCPPVQGPFPSAIEIRWTNLTTGAQGNAYHGISGRCACLFSTCWVSYAHRWFATVPLAMGPNAIEIDAFGPAMLPGSDTLTVTRTPPAPEGLVARGAADAIELSWESVGGADSYDLWWSPTRDVSPATATRIAGVTSPFRHAGLADEVTLTYAVAAVASGQAGPLSSTTWATTGWSTELLPFSAAASAYASVALATDALDQAHVHLSRQAPDGTLEQNEYASDASGAWSAALVARTTWRSADLALASTGLVHLAYLRLEGLVHAWGTGGAWSTEVVDALGTCEARLALDASDDVHLAYRASPTELRYARRSTGWLAERVDAADLGCSSGLAGLALAVEGDGTPHLAYAGVAPTHGLLHATRRGGTWLVETIAPGSIEHPALALAFDGTPHVVFADVESVLQHARRLPDGTWTLARIDPEPHMAMPSLALDATGHAHLSYLCWSHGGELRHASDTTGSWRIVRVAPATYSDVALALDFQGGVHVAYFDGAGVAYAVRR